MLACNGIIKRKEFKKKKLKYNYETIESSKIIKL